MAATERLRDELRQGAPASPHDPRCPASRPAPICRAGPKAARGVSSSSESGTARTGPAAAVRRSMGVAGGIEGEANSVGEDGPEPSGSVGGSCSASGGAPSGGARASIVGVLRNDSSQRWKSGLAAASSSSASRPAALSGLPALSVDELSSLGDQPGRGISIGKPGRSVNITVLHLQPPRYQGLLRSSPGLRDRE